MGLPRPPAFLDPSVDEDMILQNGLSYASGGGGILNDTGKLFVSWICYAILLHVYHQLDACQLLPFVLCNWRGKQVMFNCRDFFFFFFLAGAKILPLQAN